MLQRNPAEYMLVLSQELITTSVTGGWGEQEILDYLLC